MDGIIRHGRDVQEAVQNALHELEVSIDEVSVDVLDEGSKGLLGLIGHREAKVCVTVDRNKVRQAEEFVRCVAAQINPELQISIHEDEQFILCEIDGDDLGLIIGRHGETLNAIQYLLNVTASRNSSDRRPIILDAGKYRERRKQDLVQIAHRMAHRARSHGRPVKMSALPPHERKIVHTTLQDDPRVTTHSEGMDPRRYVVITPVSRGSE